MNESPALDLAVLNVKIDRGEVPGTPKKDFPGR